MTEEELGVLLALPRESLIEDLRNVLRSGIGHYLQKYEFHRPLDAGERRPHPATPYEYYSEAYRRTPKKSS